MCSHKHYLHFTPIQLRILGNTEPCLAFEAECWDAGCWDNPNNDDALLPLKKKAQLLSATRYQGSEKCKKKEEACIECSDGHMVSASSSLTTITEYPNTL